MSMGNSDTGYLRETLENPPEGLSSIIAHPNGSVTHAHKECVRVFWITRHGSCPHLKIDPAIHRTADPRTTPDSHYDRKRSRHPQDDAMLAADPKPQPCK
jgi:hypothetical protein